MARGEQSFPSTQWGWKRVKIARPPEAERHSASGASSIHSRSTRDPRKLLNVAIKYRGGAECWYELRARGAVVRVPGHVTVHDLMTLINQTH